MKYAPNVPTAGRLHLKPLALSLAGLALAAMVGLALAYVFVDRGSESPAAGASSSAPDVSLDRDAGFAFDELNGTTAAPVSFAAAATVAPVVYVVGSESHRSAMEAWLAEAAAVGYAEGVSPVAGEVLVVAPGASATFFAGMDEANSVRAAQGLSPFTVVDLR